MVHKLLNFITDLYQSDPRANRIVLALVTAGGVLEGVGIILFLPFFQSVAELSVGGVDMPVAGGIGAPDWMTASQVLLATCVLFFLVMALRAGVLGLRDARVYQLVLGFVDALRLSLFRSVAESPWPKQAELDQSEIESALITGTERVRAAAILASMSTVDIIMVVVQSAIIFYLSPILAVISLTMIAAALIALYPQIRQSFALGNSLTAVEQELHQISTEFLADLKTAKSQNMEASYTRRFSETLGTRKAALTGFRYRQILAQSLLQLAVAAVAIVILLSGIFLLSADPATTLLMVIVLGRVTAPVFRLYSNYQALIHTLPVYEKLKGLEETFSKSAPPDTRQAAIEPGSWAGPILDFDGVSFARPGAAPVLNDISLTINVGDRIALFGPSGSGKTTFLDVALGLHMPTSGQLRFFGCPANEETAISFRDFCSYVPQDAFLMNTSIRDNLLWVCPDADDAVLRAALEGAGAAMLRLDQEVGDRGARLSGGERQRVRLAQALLRRPRLLVLDEALNAIGQDAVAPLMESLRAFDETLTLIYVTHRLSDIKEIEIVYEMSGGKLLPLAHNAFRDSEIQRSPNDTLARSARSPEFEI